MMKERQLFSYFQKKAVFFGEFNEFFYFQIKFPCKIPLLSVIITFSGQTVESKDYVSKMVRL